MGGFGEESTAEKCTRCKVLWGEGGVGGVLVVFKRKEKPRGLEYGQKEGAR